MSNDDEAAKIKIEQYNRCYEDIRHYDNGLWQILSANVTIAGILIALSFQYLSGASRFMPLFLAFVLSLALTVTMSKYIFFQLGRTEFMRKVECWFDVEGVPTSTPEIASFFGYCIKQSGIACPLV